MVALAVFQNRESLAEDNWVGLPFFLIPVVVGVGGFVVLMVWLTSRGDKKRNDSLARPGVVPDTSQKTPDDTPSEVQVSAPTRGQIVYRRVRTVATISALVPAALLGYNTTQAAMPYGSRCDLARLERDIIHHNWEENWKASGWKAQQEAWSAAKDEVEAVESDRVAALNRGDILKYRELTKKLAELPMKPMDMDKPVGRLRNLDQERLRCLQRQKYYDNEQTAAVFLGLGVFIFIPVIVFALLFFAPKALRWITAADHND